MLIHSSANLAQFYRDQRKRHGLSQSIVARDASLRQDTVSKFELNPSNARLDTLFRLLDALDLELHLQAKGGESGKEQSGWTESW